MAYSQDIKEMKQRPGQMIASQDINGKKNVTAHENEVVLAQEVDGSDQSATVNGVCPFINGERTA